MNVEAQRRDPNSMLNWMERMIRLRKECPELGWGDYAILKTRSSTVLALQFEWRKNALVTLHNFHEKPVTVSLALKGRSAERLMNLWSPEHSQAGPDGIQKIVLEGYGYRWYRVRSLGHILQRQKYRSGTSGAL